MEDEEEKKVDTQTAEEVEETNATEKEGTEDQKQEKNTNTDTETEESVAKAFGNTTERNKNEGEKGKKNKSVAQTNADGSITFKNQAELDGFINRMYNKGAKSVEQKANSVNEEQAEESAEGNRASNTEEQEEKVQIDIEGLMAKIALDMIDAGINPKKARKAARLVDMNKVVANGSVDIPKLKTEIDEIVAEWPELKNEESNEVQSKGFAFGASQGNSNSNSEDAEISKIFGNS